jgi:hypothetical protein
MKIAGGGGVSPLNSFDLHPISLLNDLANEKRAE